MWFRKFSCCLGRGCELFLFEQKVCLLCVGRANGVNDRFDGLDVQKRIIRAGSTRCGRRSRFRAQERVVGGGCGRGFLRRLASAPRPGWLRLNHCCQEQKNRPDANKTLNKRKSTHNAHDCMRERVGKQTFRCAGERRSCHPQITQIRESA